MSKSQVFVVRRFWVFCRNVSRTFVELCVETPYWRTVLVHQYRRRKSTKTSGIQKLFLFTRQLAYVRINISSNTWNGYAAENQEERIFFQRDSISILVSRIAKTRMFKLPTPYFPEAEFKALPLPFGLQCFTGYKGP